MESMWALAIFCGVVLSGLGVDAIPLLDLNSEVERVSDTSALVNITLDLHGFKFDADDLLI